MKVNINQFVRFKLTQHGKEALRNYVVNTMAECHYPSEYSVQAVSDSLVKPRLYEEGYYEAQLWQLMQVFGSEMWNGNDICFEDNSIEILGVNV